MESSYTQTPPKAIARNVAAAERYRGRQERAYSGLVGSLLRRGVARRRGLGRTSSAPTGQRRPVS